MNMRFLLFVSISMLLSLIPMDGVFSRYGITDPMSIFMLKFMFIAIIAWPLSYLFTRSNQKIPRHKNMVPLEDVSESPAKDMIIKDNRYSPELRKLIASELPRNTIKFKWNPAIHDLWLIPASMEPNAATNSILERFYMEQADILARYGS